MLESLGEPAASARLLAAIASVCASGPRTRDLGGSATTDDVAAALLLALARAGA